jgi:hypothetical protein
MKPYVRLYIAGLAILVAGIVAAVLIYMTADDASVHPAIQGMLDSKPYNRALQHFGGKAAVIFDELNRWFAALWQGRTLASTVLWLSLGASALLFLLGRRLERR